MFKSAFATFLFRTFLVLSAYVGIETVTFSCPVPTPIHPKIIGSGALQCHAVPSSLFHSIETEDTNPDFTKAAEASIKSVVHVTTTSLVFEQDDPWLSMLGMAAGRWTKGSGSGVILEENGLIVTNHHVIDQAREVQVNLSDGRSYDAQVIGSDPSTDLAILKIEPDDSLQPLRIGNSDDVKVGQWVLAVGNPLNLTSTVTAGIVSAKGRNIQLLASNAERDVFPVESFIQTDAAVNPGNSGGALVNLDGELIGINTAIASQTGSYAGYSFAIPSSIVGKVVADLKEFGSVQRAYLGVQIDSNKNGIVIAATPESGGAKRAGIVSGDQIVSIDNHEVKSFPMLQEQLAKHRPGDEVELTIRRGSGLLNLTVTLTDRHGQTPALSMSEPPSAVSSKVDWQEEWGVNLVMASSELKEHLGVRGGVVADVVTDGLWKQHGLNDQFVLLRVDGAPIQSVEDVRRSIARAAQLGDMDVLLEGMTKEGVSKSAHIANPPWMIQSRN